MSSSTKIKTEVCKKKKKKESGKKPFSIFMQRKFVMLIKYKINP